MVDFAEFHLLKVNIAGIISIYRLLVSSAPLAPAQMFLRSKPKPSPKIQHQISLTTTKLSTNFHASLNFPVNYYQSLLVF